MGWARASVVGSGVSLLTVAASLWGLQAVAGPYPLSTQWADSGYIVFPLLMAALVTYTVRDRGEAWAGQWLRQRAVADSPRTREAARRWVQRTRTARAIGFFAGLMPSMAAAWSVNTAGLPSGSATRDRLLDVATGSALGMSDLNAAIVGYALGAVAAELLRLPASSGAQRARTADLRPRVQTVYAQPLARWAPRALAAVALLTALLGALITHQPTAGPSSASLATIAALTLAVTEAFRWLVARRRQRTAGADELAFDDAARATSAHAVSGSAVAVIGGPLGTYLYNASLDLSGPLRWLSVAGSSISLVSIGIWLGFGVGLVWIVRRRPHVDAGEPGSST